MVIPFDGPPKYVQATLDPQTKTERIYPPECWVAGNPPQKKTGMRPPECRVAIRPPCLRWEIRTFRSPTRTGRRRPRADRRGRGFCDLSEEGIRAADLLFLEPDPRVRDHEDGRGKMEGAGVLQIEGNLWGLCVKHSGII